MNFKQRSFVTCRPAVHSIKVKLSLCNSRHHAMKIYPMCFIKHHNMKTYGGGIYIHVFVTWALHGGEWSASCTVRFNPDQRTELFT